MINLVNLAILIIKKYILQFIDKIGNEKFKKQNHQDRTMIYSIWIIITNHSLLFITISLIILYMSFLRCFIFNDNRNIKY